MAMMLPSENYLELRFEDLVTSPRDNLIKSTQFLGVEYKADMIESYNRNLSKKLPPASHQYHPNLTKPIDSSFCYKWKKTLSIVDQEISLDIAGDILGEFGYPVDRNKISSFKKKFRKALYFARTHSTP